MHRPAETGWTWASPNPGVTLRPRSSTTRVRDPVSPAIDASEPTATIRPSRTATALAMLRARSMVAIRPPRRTRSAGRSVAMGRG